jgi:hypothetical protein
VPEPQLEVAPAPEAQPIHELVSEPELEAQLAPAPKPVPELAREPEPELPLPPAPKPVPELVSEPEPELLLAPAPKPVPEVAVEREPEPQLEDPTEPAPESVGVRVADPEPEPRPEVELEPEPVGEVAIEPQAKVEPEPVAAEHDDRDQLIASLRVKLDALEAELAQLQATLEAERAKEGVQVHVWPDEQPAATQPLPSQKERYLLCVPTPAGYILLDRIGAVPLVGEEVDVPEEEGQFTVTKVVRLPRNGRHCAYLQRG